MKSRTVKWIFFGGVCAVAGIGLFALFRRHRAQAQQQQQLTQSQQVAQAITGEPALQFAPSGGDFRVVMED